MGNSKKSKDYDVGYGKPPRSSQFQKGCSGNPKGRPRGSKDLNAMLLDPLMRKVQITQGGRTRKVPQVEAFMMLVTKAALSGDAAAGNKMIRMLPMLVKIAQAEALGKNAEDGATKSPEITPTDKDMLRHFAQLVADGELNFDEESTDE